MAKSILINRSPPHEDETLASWLWRLAQCNYVHSPSVLLRHLRDTVLKTTPVMMGITHGLRDPALFTALAELTNTSIEVVYQHTMHRAWPRCGAATNFRRQNTAFVLR